MAWRSIESEKFSLRHLHLRSLEHATGITDLGVDYAQFGGGVDGFSCVVCLLLKKHDVENAFLFLLESLKSLGPVDSQNQNPGLGA
jgi:hypothetical protein